MFFLKIPALREAQKDFFEIFSVLDGLETSANRRQEHGELGRSFLLTVRSFSLTVENRFGLFCLRWRIGLVFFALSGNRGLIFSAYGSPTVSKKDKP